MKDKKPKTTKSKSNKKVMSFYLDVDLCTMIDAEVDVLSKRDMEMDINRNRLVENILKRHFAIKKRLKGDSMDSNSTTHASKFIEKQTRDLTFNVCEFDAGAYLEVPADQIEAIDFKSKLSTFSFFDEAKKCYYLNIEFDAPLFVKHMRSHNFNVKFTTPKKAQKMMSKS